VKPRSSESCLVIAIPFKSDALGSIRRRRGVLKPTIISLWCVAFPIKYWFTFSQLELFRNPQFPITFTREQEAHRGAGTSAAGTRDAQ